MYFKDIIGQKNAIEYIKKNLNSGKIAHAQIISSPSGFGGMTLALAMASYLFCKSHTDEGDSCGSCPECYKTFSLQHPDLQLVFPVGSDTTLSTDRLVSAEFLPEFRELIKETTGYFTYEQFKDKIGLQKKQASIRVAESESILKFMNLKSFEGGWKIVIVYLPEKMNTETANKLLKVIEEPPKMSMFIFVTEKYYAILPTITSRCQLLRLTPLKQEEICRELISRYNLSDTTAHEIASHSDGSWCRALQLKDNDSSNKEYSEQFISLMRLCWTGNFVNILNWSNEVATWGRESLSNFVDYSVQMLRDSYIQSLGESALNNSVGSDRQFIAKFAPFVNERTIEPLVNEFSLLKRDILMNGNASIVLSHFALSVSKIFALNKQ